MPPIAAACSQNRMGLESPPNEGKELDSSRGGKKESY